MKLLETLTSQQQIELLNGSTVGIFVDLFNSQDPFFSSTYDICLGYYMYRSTNKTISPTYEKLIELKEENASIAETPENMLAKIIRSRYNDKWIRIYEALLNSQYDVLDGYSETEHKTGNNSEAITYDSSVQDDGNTGTNITTTTNNEDSADVYGFNSTAPVGSDLTYGNGSETVLGSSDENTSHNTRVKSGTDSKTFDINETMEKQGRNDPGSTMIERELNFRNRNLFFDILYKDIDSVTVLDIYI